MTGSFIRLGDSFGEDDVKIGLVSIVAISSNTVLTAVQDSNEDLMLISWRFNADGNFSRLDESGPAGRADLISSAVLLDNKVITAIREGDGDLKLTSWRIDPIDGIISRLDDSGDQAGLVGLVDTVQLRGLRDLLVTVVRDDLLRLNITNYGSRHTGRGRHAVWQYRLSSITKVITFRHTR